MPRVSDEHLAARRQQILEAAWRCFSRQGFHATSMQDVFAESGLSAGAVYRYFPSKSDLVRSTAEGILEGVGDVFEQMLDAHPAPHPEQAVLTVLSFITAMSEQSPFDRTRVAMHVFSEALRDEEIGQIVTTVALRVRGLWAQLAERWRELGYIPADSDPEAMGKALYGTTVGFLIQRHLVGDVTPVDFVAGLVPLMHVSTPAVDTDLDKPDDQPQGREEE